VPEDRILDLPNPIAWQRSEIPPTDVGNGEIRIVSAGRFVPEKAFDVLILGFAAIFDDIPNAVLEIAGDGTQRATLENLVRRLGIEERVKFPGWLSAERMASFFGGALIAVLPSRVEEGFPRMLIEAGLAGCALMGTDLGGIRDIITHDRTGVLVPANDPEALGGALLNLLRDPGYARRVGAEARIRCRQYLEAREPAIQRIRTRFELLRDAPRS
jgi:glycosyltransferase involved in cell wall biosynthesis